MLLQEIVIVFLTGLIGYGFYLIRDYREQIKKTKEQLNDKKYQVYSSILDLFFDFIKENHGQLKNANKIVSSKMISIKKELIIYAPDNIVKKYIEYVMAFGNELEPYKHMKILLELFILIRKDMGHKNSLINNEDIILLVTQSEKELNEVKKIFLK